MPDRWAPMGGVGFVVSVAVGAIFVYSGVAKLRMGHFAADLDAYRLLPGAVVGLLAATLPWAEILVGLALAFGVGGTPTLWVPVALLTVFAAAMIVNLARGRRVSCGCQGTSRPISWALVGRNLALISLTTVTAALAPVVPGLRALAGSAALSTSSAGALLAALLLAAVAARLANSTRHIRRRVLDAGLPALLGGAP